MVHSVLETFFFGIMKVVSFIPQKVNVTTSGRKEKNWGESQKKQVKKIFGHGEAEWKL